MSHVPRATLMDIEPGTMDNARAGLFGLYWLQLGLIGSPLAPIGHYWIPIGSYWAMLGSIRALLGPVGALLGPIGPHIGQGELVHVYGGQCDEHGIDQHGTYHGTYHGDSRRLSAMSTV